MRTRLAAAERERDEAQRILRYERDKEREALESKLAVAVEALTMIQCGAIGTDVWAREALARIRGEKRECPAQLADDDAECPYAGGACPVHHG